MPLPWLSRPTWLIKVCIRHDYFCKKAATITMVPPFHCSFIGSYFLQPCLLQWMIIRSNKDMTTWLMYNYVSHHNPCLLTPHGVPCQKCHFERSNLDNRITEDWKMKGNTQFLTEIGLFQEVSYVATSSLKISVKKVGSSMFIVLHSLYG